MSKNLGKRFLPEVQGFLAEKNLGKNLGTRK
jgi:hypothetical protein